jgi:hypothetical protein
MVSWSLDVVALLVDVVELLVDVLDALVELVALDDVELLAALPPPP